MVEQRLDAGCEQVARGVTSCVHQQQEEPLELAVGEAVTVDLGLHQCRRDVVARVRTLLVGHRLGVGEHLDDRHALLLGRRNRIVGGVHDLGELVQPLAIGARDAHQFGDQTRRQAAGDVVHEIAFAALDDVIDDLLRKFGDAVGEKVCVLRGEPPTHQELEAVVLGRVHVQHHLAPGSQVHLVRLGQHRAARVRAVRARLAADRADVVVLGDRPETRTVGLVVPEHRRVGPQPCVLLPRVARGERGRRREVDVRSVVGDRHDVPLRARTEVPMARTGP